MGLITLQCSGEAELTSEQKKKLDTQLYRLVLQGKDPDLQATTRDDGSVAYDVFVRTDDPEALTKAGLPINTVSGKIISARWTVEEIRLAARQESVHVIEAGGKSEPKR